MPTNEEERFLIKDTPPGEVEDSALRISRMRNARRRLIEREKELAAKGQAVEDE